MRILHIVRQFEPCMGGLEVYVKNMALEQMKLGHRCTVLTLDRNFSQGEGQGALPAREAIDGIEVIRTGFVGKRRMFWPLMNPLLLRRFDVIHVHNTDGFFLAVALYGTVLGLGRRLFATTHGGIFHTAYLKGFKEWYFRNVIGLAAKAYRRIFATSKNDYGIFKPIAPRMDLFPNAVKPLGDFTASGDDFIYIGRLSEHKRVDNLIRAFAKVFKKMPKGNLYVVGGEWDVKIADLQAIVAEEGMEKRIRLEGSLTAAQLERRLKGCGYFVSASEFEGFGLSMIEGMSVGLVPLVEGNASFRDLVKDGGVGRCIPYAKPDEAAKAIVDAVAFTIPKHRAKARAFAKTFAWEELAAGTLAAYGK